MLAHDEPLHGSRAFDPAVDTAVAQQKVDVTVPADVTDALLTTLPELFYGGVNDGLLAGLALAFARWRASDATLVRLEGHGREE